MVSRVSPEGNRHTESTVTIVQNCTVDSGLANAGPPLFFVHGDDDVLNSRRQPRSFRASVIIWDGS